MSFLSKRQHLVQLCSFLITALRMRIIWWRGPISQKKHLFDIFSHITCTQVFKQLEKLPKLTEFEKLAGGVLVRVGGAKTTTDLLLYFTKNWAKTRGNLKHLGSWFGHTVDNLWVFSATWFFMPPLTKTIWFEIKWSKVLKYRNMNDSYIQRSMVPSGSQGSAHWTRVHNQQVWYVAS